MFYLLIFLLIIKSNLGLPTVHTQLGTIRGTYRVSYLGRTYSAFEGIPYAKPPINELRFKDPQPIDGWHGTLNANRKYNCINFSPEPHLWGIRGHENCLYAYIYVPRDIFPKNFTDTPLDVVVHIHGYTFMNGSPHDTSLPDYLMDHNLILITFNYRLGILGFLSTGLDNDEISGNMGLKDQVMLLEWVRENVAHFGGNPQRVTLTGWGAGAIAVHLHQLSPMSRGLFHRAWSQSGTALQSNAIAHSPLLRAQKVAAKLKCPIHNLKRMIDCLRMQPAKKLMMAQLVLFVLIDAIPTTPFGPVLEQTISKPFLTKHPYLLLNERRLECDVPYVVSTVKNEGLYPIRLLSFFNRIKEFDANWMKFLPNLLEFNDTTVGRHDMGIITKKLKDYYFDGQSLNQDNLDILGDMVSDWVHFNTEKAIRLHSRAAKNPIYYYQFNYDFESKLPSNDMIKGIEMIDDHRLIWKQAHDPDILNEHDEQMMKYMTRFLADFAKTGVPMIHNVLWQPIDPDMGNIDLLQIDSPEEIWMGTKTKLGTNDFWNTIPIKNY